VDLDGNWLTAQDCGNSCDGTNPFRDLPPILCRPTGDWVIRATFSCTFIGACCDVDAVCSDAVPNTTCLEQRGTFMGDGVFCGNVSCPPPVGACCFGGSCLEDVGEALCEGLSGAVYVGNGEVCTETLCTQGACCMPDGLCEDMLDGQCAAAGGTFHGGTDCGSFSCPQPRGACCIQELCFPNQQRSVCEQQGTWMGIDTTCIPDPCAPQGCPGAAMSDEVPPGDTVDARQPHAAEAADPRQGIGSAAEPIVATLGSPGAEACFELCESAPDPVLGANDVATVVDIGGGRYEIVLNRPITPGEATTILQTGDASFLVYISHPGNVNADAVADTADLISLARILRDEEIPIYGPYSADLDRTGLSTPADLLRAVDLMLGGDAFDRAWFGTDLPGLGACP
jgi:hypothetical protein